MSTGKNVGKGMHNLSQKTRELLAQIAGSPLARTILCAGIAVHLAGFLLFSVVAPPESAPPFPQPYLVLLPTDDVRTVDWEGVADTDLLDSAPLFLPTPWNAGLRGRALLARQQPQPLFAAFAPNIQIDQVQAGEFMRGEVVLPKSAADLLADDGRGLFTSFGQLDTRPASAMTPRGASMQVISLASGQMVHQQQVAHEDLNIVMPFGPVEYLLMIDASGQVGTPLPASGQPGDEMRVLVSDLLRKHLLEHKVGPGYYRIILGP